MPVLMYTISQRDLFFGIGEVNKVGDNAPWFVVGKRSVRNISYVGQGFTICAKHSCQQVYQSEFTLHEYAKSFTRVYVSSISRFPKVTVSCQGRQG